MRIFLTGATGYLGSAILEAFVRGGHEVVALVRNTEKAAEAQRQGARSVIGDLARPEAFRPAAAGCDTFVHAARDHSARGVELDRLAIDTLVTAAAGSPGAALIYTSGVWILGETRTPAAEDAGLNPLPLDNWRPAHERRVLEAAGDGLRTIVVRPGIVYGGARGLVGDMLRDARNGLIRIVGNGGNRWALVHARDLGDLYVRLACRSDAYGVFHANDEGDERVEDIAGAIAAAAPIRPDIRRIPLSEARRKIGPQADALAADQIVRSPRARALGWAPALRSVAGNAPRLFEEWRRGSAT